MNGLKTANAPSSSIIIPHFVMGSLAFIIVTILLFTSANEWINLYFNPKLIAITHIAVLGWASMIAFGALYQLIPVIYETSLFSEKLAKITFVLFSLSVLMLSYSFWIASFSNLLFYASLLMFFSLFLFIVNLALTYRKRTKINIQSRFISTALFWLAMTELLGTLIAWNFKFPFLSDTHLHYLKIHAHFGLLGWFILLIIGASSVLIPMFMISHTVNIKKLNIIYYLINFGLIGLALNWLITENIWASRIFGLSILLGILVYISFIYQIFKNRIRKVLDTGLKLTIIAVVFMIIPFVISLLILGMKWDDVLHTKIAIIYGFGIIFGVISTIILGQIYKILPFIVWLKIYQAFVGKFKTPLPRELYSEKLAKVQMIIYILGYSIMLSGILFQHLIILKIGIFLLIITATLNFLNVLKITFHRPKLTSI